MRLWEATNPRKSEMSIKSWIPTAFTIHLLVAKDVSSSPVIPFTWSPARARTYDFRSVRLK
jgi:hypothetical protein